MVMPFSNKKTRLVKHTKKRSNSANSILCNKKNKNKNRKRPYYTTFASDYLPIIFIIIMLPVLVYVAIHTVFKSPLAKSEYVENKSFNEGSYTINNELCINSNKLKINLRSENNNAKYDDKQFNNCKIYGEIATGWRRLQNDIGNQEFTIEKHGNTRFQKIKAEEIETGIEQNIVIPSNAEKDFTQYSIAVKGKIISGQMVVRVEGKDYFTKDLKSEIFYSDTENIEDQDIGGIIDFIPQKIQVFTGLPDSEIEIGNVNLTKLDSIVEYSDENDLSDKEKLDLACGTDSVNSPFSTKKYSTTNASSLIKNRSNPEPEHKKYHNNQYTSACIMLYFPENYNITQDVLNELYEDVITGIESTVIKFGNEVRQNETTFNISNWSCGGDTSIVAVPLNYKLPDYCLDSEYSDDLSCYNAKIELADLAYSDLIARNYDRHQLNIAFVYGGQLAGDESISFSEGDIDGVYKVGDNVIILSEQSAFGNGRFGQTDNFYEQVTTLVHEMGHAMGLDHSYYPSIMGYDGYEFLDTYWFTEKYLVCDSDLNSNKGSINCNKYHHETINTDTLKRNVSLSGDISCSGLDSNLKEYINGEIEDVKLYLADLDNGTAIELPLYGTNHFNVGAVVDIAPIHRYGFLADVYDSDSLSGSNHTPAVSFQYMSITGASYYFIDPNNNGNILLCPEYGPRGSCRSINELDFIFPLPSDYCNPGTKVYEGKYDVNGMLTCENKTLPHGAASEIGIFGTDESNDWNRGYIDTNGKFVLKNLENRIDNPIAFIVTGREDTSNLQDVAYGFYDYSYGNLVPFSKNIGNPLDDLMVTVSNENSVNKQYDSNNIIINLPSCDLKRDISIRGSVSCFLDNNLNLPGDWGVRIRIEKNNKFVQGVGDTGIEIIELNDSNNFTYNLHYDPIYNYLFHVEIYDKNSPDLVGNYYRDWYSVNKVRNGYFVMSELDRYFQPKAYSNFTATFNDIDLKLSSCDVDDVCSEPLSTQIANKTQSGISAINVPKCETPDVANPHIDFNVDKSVVDVFKTFTLTWNVENATSCVANADWSGSKPLVNQVGETIMANSVGEKKYSLTCTNATGGFATRTVNVQVRDPSKVVNGTVTCQFDSDQAIGKRIVLTRDDGKKWYSNNLIAVNDNVSQVFNIKASGVNLYDGHIYSIRPDIGESENGLQFDPNGGGTYECVQVDPDNKDFLRVKRNVVSNNCSYDDIPMCRDIGTSSECWQHLDPHNVKITATSCSEHPSANQGGWASLCNMDNAHGNWFNMTDKAYFYVEKDVPGGDGDTYFKICFDKRFPPHDGNPGTLGQTIYAEDGDGFLIYVNRGIEFNNDRAVNPDFVTGNRLDLVVGDFDGIGEDTPDVFCTKTNNTVDDKHSITMDEIRSKSSMKTGEAVITVFPDTRQHAQKDTCYKKLENVWVGCRDIATTVNANVTQKIAPAPASNTKITWFLEGNVPDEVQYSIWKGKYDSNLDRYNGSIIAMDLTGSSYVDTRPLDPNSSYMYAVMPNLFCEDQEGMHRYSNNTVVDVYDAYGLVDEISGGTKCNIIGWARDQDLPKDAIDIHVYVDGDYNSGKFVKLQKADIYRKDLSEKLGGNEYANHGFNIDLANLRDGQCHPLYLYAINVHGTKGETRKIPGENDNAIACPQYSSWNDVPDRFKQATAFIQCAE